jgi:hypothetical protein
LHLRFKLNGGRTIASAASGTAPDEKETMPCIEASRRIRYGSPRKKAAQAAMVRTRATTALFWLFALDVARERLE